MARSSNKSGKAGGVFIGPILVYVSCAALWANETRFDYHAAASDTPVISSPSEASDDELFSLTGAMNQELTYPGEYVESLRGHLAVVRRAEIYAWDRDEDDDGDVSWSLRWMSSVESNSRNDEVTQQLSSTEFRPDRYEIGELGVTPNKIEFVDSKVSIDTSQLSLSKTGSALGLQSSGAYLYLRKGGAGDNLGDERASYSGVEVPPTATYFGKYSSSDPAGGVPDTSNERSGMINSLISDSGVLHHIVAGDRDTALATMRQHIRSLRWVVRAIATVTTVFGLFFFFAGIVRFLFRIPLIGPLAEAGSFLLAVALGLPLALIIMATGYFAAHPLVAVVIVGAIVGAIFMIRQRGAASQSKMRNELAQQYGQDFETLDLKDLEFIELAQLAMRDSSFSAEENTVLKEWARKQHWSDEKYADLLKQARKRKGNAAPVRSDEHFANLMQLALADGELSPFEMRSIRRVAGDAGYDRQAVDQMAQQVEQSVHG